MVGMWLGEIRSCSCLAVLPDSAWVLLNKIYQPFFTSLYSTKHDVFLFRRGYFCLKSCVNQLNFGLLVNRNSLDVYQPV